MEPSYSNAIFGWTLFPSFKFQVSDFSVDAVPEFRGRIEFDHTPGAEDDPFTCLRVSSAPGPLELHLELAEPRDEHVLPPGQSILDNLT